MSLLTKAILHNSLVVTAAESKAIVNKAIRLHGLSPVAAAALGRSLTMAALMAAQFKQPSDYLTATVKGDGELGTITVCADGCGHVKGCVDNPVVQTYFNGDGHLDVGKAVGKNGSITVIKDIGLKQPYVGTSQLVSGEIAADFAYYFASSEQKPCGIALGVGLQKGRCVSAGGVFLEVLPQCDDALISRAEEIMRGMQDASVYFRDAQPRQVIEKFFGELQPQFTEEREIAYKCNCGKRKIKGIVKGLGYDEASAIVREVGKLEVCCHFCGKKYCFTQQDLDKLFKR